MPTTVDNIGNEAGTTLQKSTVETETKIDNSTSRRVFRRKKNKKIKKLKEEEIKDPHEPSIRLYHHLKIFQIFGLNWFLIIIGSLGAMAYGVIPIICQYIIGDLIDAFFAGSSSTSQDAVAEAKHAVSQTAIKFTIITFCGAAAFFLQHFFLQISNTRCGTALRKAYMSALTKQEMTFFDIKKIGALTVVLSEDIPKIQDVYTNELFVFLQEIIQFVVGFILAMTVNWRMALILVSTTPLTFSNFMICSSISTYITKLINKLTEHSASVANEITSCMKTVKSMAGEEKEIERFKVDLYKINNRGIAKGFVHGTAYALAAMITWGTVALGFYYGGNQVADMYGIANCLLITFNKLSEETLDFVKF